MTHARARFALLALVAVVAVGVLVPAQASALTSNYNCVNKPHNQWCDGKANGSYDGQHSWDYNEAWNPGGGSFTVCQGLWKPSAGIWLANITCGGNWIGRYYGVQTCACLEANILQQSGSPKSINGFADTDW
jgi:hypothetical protein